MSDGVKVFAGGPYRRKNSNGLKSYGKTASVVYCIDQSPEMFLRRGKLEKPKCPG